jgi:hypothetical protein
VVAGRVDAVSLWAVRAMKKGRAGYHLPTATPEACQPPAVRDLLALGQDFEQLANLPLLDEGMPQGKLRLDLVAVPPALSLA